ncbi:MAG: hypothetical protein HY835_00280 [Anaerolineae bacterium]|nr:hypothetical protein [Anaerolineae bacterium]
MKMLTVSPSGNTLFHSTRENTVDVWEIGTGRLLCTCPGIFCGTSDDGAILITNTPAGLKLWETQSGLERESAAVSTELFQFHQRTIPFANRFKLSLELRDSLGLNDPQVVNVEHDLRYYPALDAWALAPDNRSLVVTLSGEIAGQDWASGQCIDLASGTRRFKFKVNKYQSVPPINFSVEHNQLLISDDIYHLAIFDLTSGRSTREVWVNGFTNVAATTVFDPWLVAVAVWEPTQSAAVTPFSVQILNVEHLIGGRMQRAGVEAVLPEDQAVLDLVCAPDGVHLASLLSNGVIHWWNLERGKIEAAFEMAVNPE